MWSPSLSCNLTGHAHGLRGQTRQPNAAALFLDVKDLGEPHDYPRGRGTAAAPLHTSVYLSAKWEGGGREAQEGGDIAIPVADLI